MLRSIVRAAAVVALAGFAVVVIAAPASAHELRRVGSYQFAVGWQHEPAYAGTENAVQLFLHDASGAPVDDLGQPTTLRVQAIYGSVTSPPLDLEPSFDPDTGQGTHGEWDAALTPTQPGTYTFHFTGSIHGQRIDERFSASPSTFAVVQNPSAIEFPAKTPSSAELAAGLARSQDRAAAAKSSADDASSTATTAIAVAGVAIVVALGGLVVAVVAVRRGRRSTTGAG
jgi:hypothetical protein